ncbi:MAG TPA: hypothetical protein VH062_03445 [Polyangiaceae bacterium]|nr:hypothetical protein [Polyangiaceae bacterium]
MLGGPESLGRRQAFVLCGINYAAHEVPAERAKLGREVVLYSLWKVGAASFDVFENETAHELATEVIARRRSAGGRGRTKCCKPQEYVGLSGAKKKLGASSGPPV